MSAEPSRCVVVENSPSGVAAAVSAGMRVFGYAADSDELALREAGAEILGRWTSFQSGSGSTDAAPRQSTGGHNDPPEGLSWRSTNSAGDTDLVGLASTLLGLCNSATEWLLAAMWRKPPTIFTAHARP
jgi:hypothetical protein